MSKLTKAREYETEHLKSADSERPEFHFTGPIGWINDPNGFSIYKNKYHLFYQYNPYETKHGPMHWGHAKSKDLFTWEYLPAALAPEDDYDHMGCFSGSAIQTPDGKHLLMYTGVRNQTEPDGTVKTCQVQCIACGNGVEYQKFEGNPVIDESLLSEGLSKYDFRDPKIWYEEGVYYAVVGGQTSDGSGVILCYNSLDGLHWEFSEIIDSCKNEYGKMWECPDFFALGEQHVLLTSPQEIKEDGYRFHVGHGTIAVIGTTTPTTENRKKTFHFQRDSVQAIDHGIDFYAPQTLETPDGRRIMIAWMENWANVSCVSPEAKIFGQMTIPRELSIRNGILCQNPVREIYRYYDASVIYPDEVFKGYNDTISLDFDHLEGRTIDMTAIITPQSNLPVFTMYLAQGDDENLVISYSFETNVVKMDRTLCGGGYDIPHVREFLATPKDGRIKLRVILDKYSAELFVNDGEAAASMKLYTDGFHKGIAFEATDKVHMHLEYNTLLPPKNMLP